jgi:hypothetical protein
MSTPVQKVNLQELVAALRGMDEAHLSPELTMLLDQGLHHAHLPPALQTGAAEAFQLAFEAWGGIPRLLMFADRYPGAFLKLYARQTAPTMAPVLPKETSTPDAAQWPEWLTHRRLAYQESGERNGPVLP